MTGSPRPYRLVLAPILPGTPPAGHPLWVHALFMLDPMPHPGGILVLGTTPQKLSARHRLDLRRIVPDLRRGATGLYRLHGLLAEVGLRIGARRPRRKCGFKQPARVRISAVEEEAAQAPGGRPRAQRAEALDRCRGRPAWPSPRIRQRPAAALSASAAPPPPAAAPEPTLQRLAHRAGAWPGWHSRIRAWASPRPLPPSTPQAPSQRGNSRPAPLGGSSRQPGRLEVHVGARAVIRCRLRA